MKKGFILILFFVIIQSIAQEHFTGINTSKRNGLLNGNLIEKKFDNIEIIDHLKSNNILYLQNKYGFHKLSNPNNINATSIILHSIK